MNVLSMIKVTFDTNTFDKAVRPQVYAKDPNHGRFLIIHEAIKDGRIAGFLCDAEGIKIDDRAEVFGSTTLTSKIAEEGPETIRVDMRTEQPLRSPLPPSLSVHSKFWSPRLKLKLAPAC